MSEGEKGPMVIELNDEGLANGLMQTFGKDLAIINTQQTVENDDYKDTDDDTDDDG